MTPLGELIEEVKKAFLDEHGIELSNGDIVKRAGDAFTRTRMQQLAAGPIKEMPAPHVLEGLAKGLGVSHALVLQRALESSGYELPSEFTIAARRRPKE